MRGRKNSLLMQKNQRMKSKTAVIVLTAGILTAGFCMPGLIMRMLDQRIDQQTDTFAGEKIESNTDTRLIDMLVLANRRNDEIYLNHGLMRNQEGITASAEKAVQQLKSFGILDEKVYNAFSASAYLATQNNLSYIYDELDGVDWNIAGGVSESAEEREKADQENQNENNMLMGVIWRCSGAGQSGKENLECAIDDWSGKLLSFVLCANKDKKEIEEIHSRMQKDPDRMKKEIHEDLEKKSKGMEKFCRENYGFHLKRTKYHMEEEDDQLYGVKLFFQDSEDNEIRLILKRNLEGTIYRWNC